MIRDGATQAKKAQGPCKSQKASTTMYKDLETSIGLEDMSNQERASSMLHVTSTVVHCSFPRQTYNERALVYTAQHRGEDLFLDTLLGHAHTF